MANVQHRTRLLAEEVLVRSPRSIGPCKNNERAQAGQFHMDSARGVERLSSKAMSAVQDRGSVKVEAQDPHEIHPSSTRLATSTNTACASPLSEQRPNRYATPLPEQNATWKYANRSLDQGQSGNIEPTVGSLNSQLQDMHRDLQDFKAQQESFAANLDSRLVIVEKEVAAQKSSVASLGSCLVKLQSAMDMELAAWSERIRVVGGGIESNAENQVSDLISLHRQLEKLSKVVESMEPKVEAQTQWIREQLAAMKEHSATPSEYHRRGEFCGSQPGRSGGNYYTGQARRYSDSSNGSDDEKQGVKSLWVSNLVQDLQSKTEMAYQGELSALRMSFDSQVQSLRQQVDQLVSDAMSQKPITPMEKVRSGTASTARSPHSLTNEVHQFHKTGTADGLSLMSAMALDTAANQLEDTAVAPAFYPTSLAANRVSVAPDSIAGQLDDTALAPAYYKVGNSAEWSGAFKVGAEEYETTNHENIPLTARSSRKISHVGVLSVGSGSPRCM
jgi:hypothetical protein